MKTVRKIIPVSLYDIPGLEQWLAQQADQGLFPVKLGSWAVFEDRGVPGTRFRIESCCQVDDRPKSDQVEFYQEAGWDYALSFGRSSCLGGLSPAFHLFSAADPNAPELHTDSVLLGDTLGALAKKLARDRRLLPLFTGITLLCWASIFRNHLSQLLISNRLSDWLTPGGILVVALPLMAVYLILRDIVLRGKDCSMLIDAQKALRLGLPLPPSPGPSRIRARLNLILLIFRTFCLFLCIMVLLLLISRQTAI